MDKRIIIIITQIFIFEQKPNFQGYFIFPSYMAPIILQLRLHLKVCTRASLHSVSSFRDFLTTLIKQLKPLNELQVLYFN